LRSPACSLASGGIRKVLKIGGVDQGKEQRLANVDQNQAVLAWFGNNKVCTVIHQH